MLPPPRDMNPPPLDQTRKVRPLPKKTPPPVTTDDNVQLLLLPRAWHAGLCHCRRFRWRWWDGDHDGRRMPPRWPIIESPLSKTRASRLAALCVERPGWQHSIRVMRWQGLSPSLVPRFSFSGLTFWERLNWPGNRADTGNYGDWPGPRFMAGRRCRVCVELDRVGLIW